MLAVSAAVAALTVGPLDAPAVVSDAARDLGLVAQRPVVPVSPGRCAQLYGARCYGPVQINRAYGLDRLHAAGTRGQGRTVAVVMPFHNPDLAKDLATYSRRFGLPPAELEVLRYLDAPTARIGDPEQAARAQEASVDVQTVHATAPAAKIIAVETPSDLGGDLTGVRRLIEAIGWVAAIRPIDAVTVSYGVSEQNFAERAGGPGDYHLLAALRGGLESAYARGVTLIASTGDWGPTGPILKDGALYKFREVAWPGSDPLVTAVGGTRLHLDDHGARTAPDQVWDDPGGYGEATGGGLSRAFGRPRVQDRVADVVGDRRGVPDVALNGAPESREWHYSSRYQVLPKQRPGWVRVAGTSIAAPRLAGLVALAAQQAGRPLGDIRPALYAAQGSPAAGLTDLITGTNTANGVPGFPATPGFDLASGTGALGDGARLVRTLARAAEAAPR